jgi:hypothetical protein
MSVIHSTDPDLSVCQISFVTLLEIQLEAEDRGWATVDLGGTHFAARPRKKSSSSCH